MNKKTLMNIPRNAVMEGNDVAALNWTIVSQAAIATLEEELASISRFSLDVSGEFKTDGDSVKVEYGRLESKRAENQLRFRDAEPLFPAGWPVL